MFSLGELVSVAVRVAPSAALESAAVSAIALGAALYLAGQRELDLNLTLPIVGGGYIALAMGDLGGIVVGVLVSTILSGIVGAITGAIFFRPDGSRRVSSTSQLVASLGLVLLCESAASILFGDQRRFLPLDDGWSYALGPAEVLPATAWVASVGGSAALLGTRAGRLLRMVRDDSHLARQLGVPVRRMFVKTSTIAFSLCALGATAHVALTAIHPRFGLDLLLTGLVAAVLAGRHLILGTLAWSAVLVVSRGSAAVLVGDSWADAVNLSAVLLACVVWSMRRRRSDP